MHQGTFSYPLPANEPVLNYAPGSRERENLKAAIALLKSEKIDVPMYIGGEKVRTSRKETLRSPHDHQFVLGHFSIGDKKHVEAAVAAALKAKAGWEALSWENRAAIFLKAADLIATKYRGHMNAATMLGKVRMLTRQR